MSGELGLVCLRHHSSLHQEVRGVAVAEGSWVPHELLPHQRRSLGAGVQAEGS